MASSKAKGSRSSSGFIPSRPPTSARSVPWPAPVSAKEPYRWMAAFTGGVPSRARAMKPMRAAPAVWNWTARSSRGPKCRKYPAWEKLLSWDKVLRFPPYHSTHPTGKREGKTNIFCMIRRVLPAAPAGGERSAAPAHRRWRSAGEGEKKLLHHELRLPHFPAENSKKTRLPRPRRRAIIRVT